MPRWLYRVVTITTQVPEHPAHEPYPFFAPTVADNLQDTFTELGDHGWELAGFLPDSTSENHHAIFKKPDTPEETESMEQQSIRKSIRRHVAKQNGRK
jgi:hypothetical protein